MAPEITVIGGGIAGLTAAIACAEGGARVALYEAHQILGGRARTTAPPYRANDGIHVFYADGEPFRWLAARGLVQPFAKARLTQLAKSRFHYGGQLRASPPRALLRMLIRRRLKAPVGQDFHLWASHRFGEDAALAAAGLAGILTYTADPGRLSAAFVWERLLRATKPSYPAARYVTGGWGAVIARMAALATHLGVRVETGARVEALLSGPVIVATDLAAARQLLTDPLLRWGSGSALLHDIGLVSDPADLFLISDLDSGGFVENYSMVDGSLAPQGHSLIQTQLPLRAGESRQEAIERLDRLIALGFPSWQDRITWQRSFIANARTGALDLPGTTWRDRPAIDRGSDVWLIGDSVAAPGLLSEVSVTSARQAAAAALTRLI